MDAVYSTALLVHRDKVRATELARTLEPAGIKVQIAGGRLHGLSMAREGADVIILEVGLGPSPGSLVESFTQDENAGGIPVFALSEDNLPEDEVNAILAAGAMDVLTPPFSAPIFLARVRNLVRIHREEKQHRETEQRYRRIFSSSSHGYFLSSREGRFLEANQALVEILGYSSVEEIMKLKLPDDLYLRHSDRDLLQMLLEKNGFVKDFKVDFKRKDGSIITIILTANIYRKPDGETVGYEGFNVPLFDTEISTGKRFLARLLRPFVRYFPKRRNFLSVARISEMIANRYEKSEELSEGIFTSVWRGRDVLGFEKSPLVIKISRSNAVNARLLMEAQALRELAGHPGVPELVDVTRHKDRTVIVTRFVEGKPLNEVMSSLGTIERDRVAYQLMDVVAYLHDHNIVHRDIKPDNIIFRPDGGITLLDYGIVRKMEESELSATVIGTRPFMSPEQIEGRSERRTDIWGIGVVLYQLYTGRLPFEGNTEKEIMENILRVEPPTPRSLNGDLSAQLEGILIRALRKHPEGRFKNAGEMRDFTLSRVPGFRANVMDQDRVPKSHQTSGFRPPNTAKDPNLK